jgi:hypothetical protein
MSLSLPLLRLVNPWSNWYVFENVDVSIMDDSNSLQIFLIPKILKILGTMLYRLYQGNIHYPVVKLVLIYRVPWLILNSVTKNNKASIYITPNICHIIQLIVRSYLFFYDRHWDKNCKLEERIRAYTVHMQSFCII